MSSEQVSMGADDKDEKRADINRLLALCSAPIFAFWLCTAFVVLLVRNGGRGDYVILTSAASILFFVAPLYVAIGWLKLAKSKLNFRDPSLKSGRRYLVIASVLTLPIVIFVIVAFFSLATYYGH